MKLDYPLHEARSSILWNYIIQLLNANDHYIEIFRTINSFQLILTNKNITSVHIFYYFKAYWTVQPIFKCHTILETSECQLSSKKGGVGTAPPSDSHAYAFDSVMIESDVLVIDDDNDDYDYDKKYLESDAYAFDLVMIESDVLVIE